LDNRISVNKETTLYNSEEYRGSLKNLIQVEVGNIIDEEMHSAARELAEEQKKAIREVVDEHKILIRQVLEDEKKAIKERINDLRRSIIKLGLG
jgi:hypothetical protein